MNLRNTKIFMENLKKDNNLDSYAVMVYKNGDKQLITSENVDEKTYFDMASMGKVLVTSTLILKAVDMGLLSFEDKLSDFFKDIPSDKSDITIKQMLTHTSGIIRVPIPDRIADCGRDAIVWHILQPELQFKPGTSYVYSCNAYILLGFILEIIFDASLDKIYEEYLTKPLMLKRSKFNINKDEANAAICYRWKHMGKYRVDDENVYTLKGVAGSGASQSSIEDISKFCEAVLRRDSKLYSKELFELAEKNFTPLFSEGRGLGYLVVDENYKQTGKLFPIGSFGHCGHSGHSFFINRKEDMYAIILTNSTRFLNMKSGFRGYDYNIICKMREDIHNEIYKDLIKLS